MSKHRHARSFGFSRAWRALASAVPLFLIFATLFVVPSVAIAQEAPSAPEATGSTGATGATGLTGPVDPTGPPTISSDKPDYVPGETVTLSGTGWASGEAVHILVNDDASQQWSLDSNPDPVADGLGAFTYQFDLPDLFVATYSVTATGSISGTATTTFTDAIPNSVSMVNWRTSGSGAWIQG